VRLRGLSNRGGRPLNFTSKDFPNLVNNGWSSSSFALLTSVEREGQTASH